MRRLRDFGHASPRSERGEREKRDARARGYPRDPLEADLLWTIVINNVRDALSIDKRFIGGFPASEEGIFVVFVLGCLLFDARNMFIRDNDYT